MYAPRASPGCLPLFVRTLRSCYLSGIFGPGLCTWPSTGGLHQARICKATARGGSVAVGVEEVDAVGNGVYYKGSWLRRSELTARVPPAPQAGRRPSGFGKVGRCPPEPKDPHVGVQDDALSPDSHVRRPLPGSAVRPSKSPRPAGPALPPCGAAGGTARIGPLAPFGVQGPPPDQAGAPVPPAEGQQSAGPTLRSLPSFPPSARQTRGSR